jgi:NAD(P)-dependent dehydrogenase (short-subunit alcohol dehydrogenase family)
MARSTWTAADIPDQSGRTAVVTGANSGLGMVASRELARAGARVVMACRDTARGEEAAGEVRRRAPGAEVQVVPLDLADLGSVRTAAEQLDGAHDSIDLLVNNAGVMALPHRTTADGFEMQLGTNHLGHFALTGLLLPALLRGAGRVVTVSSEAHKIGKIDFDDLQSERRYRRWRAYGQSKLANLLFTNELQRRAEAASTPLQSLAAHPGYAATNLQSAGPRMEGSRVGERLAALGNRVLAQDDEMGALPLLRAATDGSLGGGTYVGPDGPLEMRGHPKPVGMSGAAKDGATAERLWRVSEELTGVRYELEPAPVR